MNNVLAFSVSKYTVLMFKGVFGVEVVLWVTRKGVVEGNGGDLIKKRE